MNNWQEWRAGTDPTVASSVLKLFPPVVSNANPSALTVTWSSVFGRNYFVERSTNLAAFMQVSSDIPGLPGTTAFADTNTVGSGPFFYRVGVR